MGYLAKLYEETGAVRIRVDEYRTNYEVHYINGIYHVPSIDIVRRTKELDDEMFDAMLNGEIELRSH